MKTYSIVKRTDDIVDRDGNVDYDDIFTVTKGEVNGAICTVRFDESAYYFDIVQSLKQVIADIEQEHIKTKPSIGDSIHRFLVHGLQLSLSVVAIIGLVKWIF